MSCKLNVYKYITHPKFHGDRFSVLLPGVAENPTFPILSALAYTTGLGYRPTCDNEMRYINLSINQSVNFYSGLSDRSHFEDH